MICDKCNGKGYTTNPKLFNVPSWRAYEMGYDIPIQCSRCGGSGFVLGNADEIIKALDIAIRNGQPLTLRELKQIRLALNK